MKTDEGGLRGSTWKGVVARVAAAAGALVLLAWIGHAAGDAPTARAADRVEPEGGGAPSVTSVAPVLAVEPTPAPAPPPGRATAAAPVHLNQADEAELRRLPGVGAKRAQAILALRAKLGRFSRVEELLRVKGVGRGTLKKWRPLVKLDRPPVDAGGPS